MTEEDRTEGAINALRALFQAGDHYRQTAADYFELGHTEYQAMAHVLSAGELGQTELANRLHITTGAVTALMDRLERLDMAERHPHPSDRRRTVIRLTDRAMAVVVASRQWTRKIFEDMSAEEVSNVVSVLNTLTARVNEQAGLIGDRLRALEAERTGSAPDQDRVPKVS